MMAVLEDIWTPLAKWLNQDQGVLTLLIFIFTLFLGWVTGIFTAWRRKPKLKLSIIAGPTFCCIVNTGRMHEGQPTHRTCFALLLNIRNVGAADTAIETMQIGYLSS